MSIVCLCSAVRPISRRATPSCSAATTPRGSAAPLTIPSIRCCSSEGSRRRARIKQTMPSWRPTRDWLPGGTCLWHRTTNLSQIMIVNMGRYVKSVIHISCPMWRVQLMVWICFSFNRFWFIFDSWSTDVWNRNRSENHRSIPICNFLVMPAASTSTGAWGAAWRANF